MRVYKVVRKLKSGYASAMAYAPLQLTYDIGKTTISKTPIFCYTAAIHAELFMRQHHRTVNNQYADLTILLGETNNPPILLCHITNRVLSLSNDYSVADVEKFWEAVKWKRAHSFETGVYDTQSYIIHDFTPLRELTYG